MDEQKQQRLRQITQMLKENGDLEGYTKNDLMNLVKDTTPENFDEILKQYDLKDYKKQLRKILFDKIPANNPEKYQIIQSSQKVFEKDIIEFKELRETVLKCQKVEGSFSYAYLKKIQLRNYIDIHPQLHQIKQLQIDQSKMVIKQDVRLLKQLLKKQNIISSNSRVFDYLDNISNSNDCLQVRRHIQEIKKDLIPIDISQLSSLIQKSRSAEGKIKNQRGIVFIGKTGAGKSTEILCLLGHKMVKRKWKQLKWITPQKLLDSDPDIKNLIANPSSKSVTRNITGILLPKDMILNQLTREKYFLIDTPGFKDTAGSTIDLANTFGAASAIKSLHQARFVIILSGKDNNSRNQGLQQMAQILNNLFPKYTQISQSIVFLFNRYSKDDLENISAIFKRIWLEMTGVMTDNKNLKSIFEDIISKTKEPANILTHDPEFHDIQYSKILLQKIMKVQASQNLRLFSVSYGTQVLNDIQKMCRILIDSCIHYFKIGLLDVCRFFLGQIRQFSELIKGGNGTQFISDCTQKIKQKISEMLDSECTDAIGKLNKSIGNGSLCKKDIQEYKSIINNISKYSHLSEYITLPDIYSRLLNNVNDKISILNQKQKMSLTKFQPSDLKTLVLLLMQFKKQDQLKQLNNHFKELQSKAQNNYKKTIQTSEYDESVVYYRQLNQLSQVWKILPLDQKQDKFPDINNLIINHVGQKIEQIKVLVDDSKGFSPEKINLIKEASTKMMKLNQSQLLRIIQNYIDVQKKLEIFSEQLTIKVTQNLDNICLYITGAKNLDKQTNNRIIKFFNQRKEMQQIPHIKHLVIRKSAGIENRIRSCLQNQKMILSKFIDEIKDKKVNYNTLVRQINQVNQAALKIEKVIQFCDSNEQTNLEEVLSKIIELLEDHRFIIQQMQRSNLDLSKSQIEEQMQNLSKTLQIVSAFNVNEKIYKKSKLFQDEEMNNIFNQIKQCAQIVFSRNVKVAQSITKTLQQQKQKKLDHEIEKYQTIKMKEIDSCLKFVHMGIRVFRSIDQKQLKFKNICSRLENQIVNWQQYNSKCIKNLFAQLLQTESDEPQLIIKNVKKKIQMFEQIKNKYVEIRSILEEKEKNFLDCDLKQLVLDLQKNQQKILKSYEKQEDAFLQLSEFIQKSKCLEVLDCYTDTKNRFFKLGQLALNRIQKLADNLQKRFQTSRNCKNFQQMFKYLEIIYDKQKQTFSWAESQVCELIKKIILTIKKQRQDIIETSNFESIIELSDQLIIIKDLIGISKIQKTSPLQKVNQQIQTVLNSIYQNIEKSKQKIVGYAQQYIRTNHLEQAYLEIKNLQRIQKILNGTESKKQNQQVNQSKAQSLKDKISQKITDFQTKYTKQQEQQKVDFKDLRQDYDSLFCISNISHYQLFQLKKKIDKRIQQAIQQKLIAMHKKEIFVNGQQLSKIQIFISQMPYDYKGKDLINKLQIEAKRGFDKWEQQKKKINQQLEDIKLFDGIYLNPVIVEYFNDESALKVKKQGIINKLKLRLKQKIDQCKEDKLEEFMKFVTNSTELVKSNEIQLKNELSLVYDFSYDQIGKKTNDLFRKQIKEIQSRVISPRIPFILQNLQRQFQIFLLRFCQYTTLFDNTVHQNIFNQHIKKSLTNTLQKFGDNMLNSWQIYQKQIGDLKQILDPTYSFELAKKKIQNLAFLFVVQNFVSCFTKCVKQQKYQSNLLKFLRSKLQKISQGLLGHTYIKFIQEILFPEIDSLFEYSIKSNKSQLNKSEIEQQLADAQLRCQYFSVILCEINKYVKNQNNLKKLEQHNQFIQSLSKEVDEIQQGILQFSINPSLDNEIIEDIENKIQVLKACVTFYPKKRQFIEKYKINVREHHEKLYKDSIELLNILKTKQEQSKKLTLQLETKIANEIKTNKIQFENILKLKLQQLKTNYENELNAQTEQKKKEDIQNEYKTNVETANNQCLQSISQNKEKLDQQLKNNKIKSQIQMKNSLSEIANNFLKMVNICENIYTGDKTLLTKNDSFIKQVIKIGSKRWLKFISQNLQNFGTHLAGKILYNHPDFKNLSKLNFKKNIKCQKIDQVLNLLQKDNKYTIDLDFIKNLKIKFEMFQTKYKKWINQFSNKGTSTKTEENLINSLKKQQKKTVNLNIEKLSQILALWSIINSQKDDNGEVEFPYQPHPVQIITLLILLGLIDNDACAQFKNRFAQIKTGQGKSVVLGTLAVFFALESKEVDCVCYSSHLSQRDSKNFSGLFSVLGISSKIKYCTFNDLAEKFIKNEKIDIRNQCEKIISYKKNLKNGLIGVVKQLLLGSKYESKNGRVLLIDESDVFFNSQFYGNLYRPSYSLTSKSIRNLLKFVWNKRNLQNNLKKKILDSSQFKIVLNEFPQLQSLLKNQVSQMIHAVKNFNHQYLVVNGKVAYKQQDGYNTNMFYGYKTVFANFYEHQKKRISELHQSILSINITLCEISFAQLPKYYAYIFGVSGTLKCMNMTKKQILKKQYQITDVFIIPSVYPHENRKNEGFLIVSEEKHHQLIINNIIQQTAKKRPIFIFFNNINQINRFYQCQSFKDYRKQTSIISQKDSFQERKKKIQRATILGKITLITRVFARGTDFIIFDSKVIEFGGIHLISTFLPQQKSQEIQMIGRVGRQGDPGSYIFILTEQQICSKYKLESTNLLGKSKQQISKQLDLKRQDSILVSQISQEQTLKKLKQKHNHTLTMFSNIINKQKETVLTDILKLNILPELYDNIKLLKIIIAVDATCSMGDALTATKNSLKESFIRIYKILEDNSIKKGFQIQMVFYRNYNVKKQILMQVSSFEHSSQNLVKFMQKIKVAGGSGNEALQVVFDHCLSIQNLSQVIIISDAKSNTKFQTIQKRKEKGQDYWSKSQKFNKPLDSEELIERIKQKKIRIHALPVNQKPDVSDYYKRICELTEGRMQSFDPLKSGAADHVTNFMSTEILRQLGDSKTSSDSLVLSYQKTYNK